MFEFIKFWKKRYLTKDEIIEDVINNLCKEDKEYLKSVTHSESQLITLHHSFGRDIRNRYKLWDKNNPYTKNQHPDNFSYDIIVEVWKRLK